MVMKIKRILRRSETVLLAAMVAACSQPEAPNVSLFPFRSDGEHQFIDRSGKVAFQQTFTNAGMFSDGLAPVSIGRRAERWGYIDEKGTYTITPTYLMATEFSEGLAWVVPENGPPTAIKRNGNTVFALEEAETVRKFSEGLAAFSILFEDNEWWGYTDANGQTHIKPQFRTATEFSDGLAAVENNTGKWGYTNKDGKMVIPFQFDDAGPFSGGIAVAAIEGRKGVIDRDGAFVINPQFSTVIRDGDRLLVKTNDKYGWCDLDGKFIIAPQFKEALPFRGNPLTAVRTDDTWGYAGLDGLYKINPQFSAALPFTDGIAIVRSERKSGFIDASGKYVVNPQFDRPARDLIAHLITGNCEFAAVNTDYFNINPALRIVQPDSLSGITDFAGLMERFQLNGEDFSGAYGKHLVKSRQRASGDIAIAVSAYGNPFRTATVRKNYGGFSYTDEEQVFDPSAPVTGFQYDIYLLGRGSGKSRALSDSLTARLGTGRRIIRESDRRVLLQQDDGGPAIEIRITGPSHLAVWTGTGPAPISD